MRSTVCMFTVCLVALCASAIADEKPPIDIPIYPGGETTLEVNMTGEELLPTLEAMLPMLVGKMADIAEKIKPEEITEALSGLKRIELVQVEIKKDGVTEADIASYYSKNIPSGKWSRVLWQSSGPYGTVALYSTEGFEDLYGFRITKKIIDGKPTMRVMAGKIEGKIDFVKLLSIAAMLVS